jgi:hypothetical protein
MCTACIQFAFVYLRKLSVWTGEGSFFKPHIDTPRGKNMFGTLVLVFPTPHGGGALILRHHGHEWTFDSGQELATSRQPCIGYIAFFSDVEHEVAPVISGHRVTLTYSIHFDDIDVPSSPDSDTENFSLSQAVSENPFHEQFQALLENPDFLADGGTLAFGLRHVYPIERDKREQFTSLKHIYGTLKGSDAVLYQTIRTLGFQPVLYMYYEWKTPNRVREGAVIDKVIDFGRLSQPREWSMDITRIVRWQGGVVVCQEGWKIDEGVECGVPEKVEWATRATKLNRQASAFAMALGNQPSLEMAYSDLCMFVCIGKAGERLVYPSISQIEEERKRARSPET